MSNYKEKLITLINAVDSKKVNWDNLVDELNLDIHPDSLRKAFATTPFSGYNVAKYFINQSSEDIRESEFQRLEILKIEIEKERKKKQAVNHEYHKLARIEGRNELFHEMMIDAIKTLSPIKIKKYNHKKSNKKTAMLFISDAHYGKTIDIKGFYGDIINHYDCAEFQNRMWNLLAQLCADEIDCEKIIVCDLGDCIDGILRMGSLQKLETGVISATLEYAEFMSNWLCELYNRTGVPIEYALTGGNHDIIRLLTEKKIFEDENIARIIHEFIKLRLQISSENQIKVKDYNDVIYHNIYGMNIMTYHGDSKNLKEDMFFFENFYDCLIDIIVVGHLHRNSSETIGFGIVGDKEILRVPSIMGVDDYSRNIRKCSRAGVKFIMFTEDGKDYEKIYYLN